METITTHDKSVDEILQRGYLKQQGLEYTKDNEEVYGAEGYKKLLTETSDNWVILNQVSTPTGYCDYLNIISKEDYEMQSYEI